MPRLQLLLTLALLTLGGCAPGRAVPAGDFEVTFTAINARQIDGERAEEIGPVRVSAAAIIRPGRHDATPLWHKSWIRIDRVWTDDGALVVNSPGPDWTTALDDIGWSGFTDPSQPFLASGAQGVRFRLPSAAAETARIAGALTWFEAARLVERMYPIERLVELDEYQRIAPGAWITARDPFRTEDGAVVTIRTWTSRDEAPPPFPPEFSVAQDSWAHEEESMSSDLEFAAQSWALPRFATIQLLDDRGDVVQSRGTLGLGWNHRDGMMDESPLSATLKPGRRLAAVRVWVVTERRVVTQPFDVGIEETVKFKRSRSMGREN